MKKLSGAAKQTIGLCLIVVLLLTGIIGSYIIAEMHRDRLADKREPATVAVYYYAANTSLDLRTKACEFTLDEREKIVEIPYFEYGYELLICVTGKNETYTTEPLTVEHGSYRAWGSWSWEYSEFTELSDPGQYTYFIYLNRGNDYWIPFRADLTVEIV